MRFFFAKNDFQEDAQKMNYKVQVLIFISITLIYYGTVSSSALFNLTFLTLNNLITSLYTHIFNPNSLIAVGVVKSEKSLLEIHSTNYVFD